MSSTTVHSNNQTETSKTTIVASEMYVTENSLEVPKDANLNKTIVDQIGKGVMEISAQSNIVIRDDNKSAMLRVDEKGNILSKTTRTLNSKELSYIEQTNPKVAKQFASKTTSKVGIEKD